MVAAVRAIRAGIVDIEKIYGFIIRRPQIKRYFLASPVKKLQLGTSNSLIAGWLNTDVLPTSRKVVYVDATRRFPFDDDTFDYVYSEHMIEHIEYETGVLMLRECFRVLKPRGKIRISAPDLKVFISLFSNEKTTSQKFYIDWMTDKFMPHVEFCKEVFLINNAFRAWGHQFLYDRETLERTMSKIGFENIRYYRPGDSDDENLKGIESHGRVMGCEEINQFEAFVVEGRVPNPKNER